MSQIHYTFVDFNNTFLKRLRFAHSASASAPGGLETWRFGSMNAWMRWRLGSLQLRSFDALGLVRALQASITSFSLAYSLSCDVIILHCRLRCGSEEKACAHLPVCHLQFCSITIAPAPPLIPFQGHLLRPRDSCGTSGTDAVHISRQFHFPQKRVRTGNLGLFN